jgi:Putative N-acetylmannosamine-6-phosphate epimerase
MPILRVYITPTLEDALEVLDAGADIIAMDATDRVRPHGQKLPAIVRACANGPIDC